MSIQLFIVKYTYLLKLNDLFLKILLLSCLSSFFSISVFIIRYGNVRLKGTIKEDKQV